MKIKSGFELRDICGEKAVIASGIENLDFSSLISLNETAAYLWEIAAARPEFTAEELSEALTREYDVDEARALADVNQLLADWKAQGLVED
ncbi:MAG: PqqD family protein [Alloprevotella sp.]